MPIEKYTATINTGKARKLEKAPELLNLGGSVRAEANPALEVQKVQNIIMIIVGIHGFVSLLSLVLSLLTGDSVATSLIRTLLTAALLYQVLQGKNWARWVTVILTILTSLMLGFGSLAMIALGGTGIGVFVFLIAMGYLACAIAFLIPPASQYFS